MATSSVRLQLTRQRWVKPGQAETRYQRSGQRWIDSLRILCQGGHGGNGLPGYGGRGGDGGSVVIQAVSAKQRTNADKRRNNSETGYVESLYEMFHKTFEGDPRKQRVKADKGGDASKYKVVGSHAEDKVMIKPPTGSIIVNASNFFVQKAHVHPLFNPLLQQMP